jgi:hypothetical protein
VFNPGVPTEAELKAETTEATTGIKVINFDSALKNFLQIPAAGFLNDIGNDSGPGNNLYAKCLILNTTNAKFSRNTRIDELRYQYLFTIHPVIFNTQRSTTTFNNRLIFSPHSDLFANTVPSRLWRAN